MRAAAALHAQERGEAEDEKKKRTNRHGCGEVPIGASFLSLERKCLSRTLFDRHIRQNICARCSFAECCPSIRTPSNLNFCLRL